MKRGIAMVAALAAVVIVAGCAPSTASILQAVAQTQAAWTPVPTQTPYPTYTPVPAEQDTGRAGPTPAATLVLSNKVEKLDIVGLPSVGIGGGNNAGVWRFYDQQAQVVCYIYGDWELLATNTTSFPTYSGMSCIPVDQTALGK